MQTLEVTLCVSHRTASYRRCGGTYAFLASLLGARSLSCLHLSCTCELLLACSRDSAGRLFGVVLLPLIPRFGVIWSLPYLFLADLLPFGVMLRGGREDLEPFLGVTFVGFGLCRKLKFCGFGLLL